MPRTRGPPGSASKRPASSASTCRGASLSWCATSETVSPSASRALLSSAPTASVILTPLQRLVLRRAGEAAPELVAIALLGAALAEPALDAQCEPQRLGARRHELVVLRDELARVLRPALPVADLAKLEQRRRLVGIELQRALEKILRVLHVVLAQAALPRRRVRAPRCLVERVLHCLHEVLDGLLRAPVLAEEIAVVMVDVRVVWRKAQPAFEVVLRERVFLEFLVDKAVEAVGRRVRGIGLGRSAQFLQRDAHGAALVIRRRKVGMHARAVARIAHAAGYRAGVGIRDIRL